MGFNDGAADGKSDSHTVGFGRIECIEDPVRCLRRETDSRILHTQPDLIAFIPLGPDEQLSRAIINCAHCVRSVSKQVQDDLLKLNAVAECRRKVIRKFLPEHDAVSLDLGRR